MQVHLERFCMHPVMGTFGTLKVWDDMELVFEAVTVEKPWKNNEPYVSCIPEGVYELVKHSSEKYGETYAMIGGTVSQYEEEGYERFACLLHGGNREKDVVGCIAVGSRLGMLGDQWAILASAVKKNALLKLLNERDEQHVIDIRWVCPEPRYEEAA